jgi:hypothetical protein
MLHLFFLVGHTAGYQPHYNACIRRFVTPWFYAQITPQCVRQFNSTVVCWKNLSETTVSRKDYARKIKRKYFTEEKEENSDLTGYKSGLANDPFHNSIEKIEERVRREERKRIVKHLLESGTLTEDGDEIGTLAGMLGVNREEIERLMDPSLRKLCS